MSLYDAVKDLPLQIDGYDLDVHSLDVSSGFTRKTTIIRLTGAGAPTRVRRKRPGRRSGTWPTGIAMSVAGATVGE